MTPLDAALRYASVFGWAVLPIQPGSKLPASAHGVKDASTDPAQIRAWFDGRPDLNLAVAAGRASGLTVFDVDPRNSGDASWGAWLAMHGPADDGVHQLTAGGGSHYLATYDPAWRSSKLAQGVDLLSDGRYFLVYPSQIGGKKYEWEASSDPFDGIAPFKIPAAWSAAYAAQANKKPLSTGDSGGLLPVGSRNAGLAALAGAMRHHGMGQAEILAALSVANELRANPPLPSSELSQIVDSICRYAADTDTALSAAIGDAAAEALSIKPSPSDYHLEQASGWLSQPALPSWLIKGWLPDSGLAMLFGPSGAGKTFCALDMAASIASGKPWHGHRVSQGSVIYLAGEGHYGLRMRVAAWAQQHGPEGLENLYISNRGIDLDAPQAAAEVIRAIREPSPTKVSLVVIDTLATHFGGEENSARDTRQLLSAAQVIGRAYGCVVCLIHHTGLGVGSADRARGSSSLKAAMDWQMLLASGEDGITLSCTKAKDSEPPQPLAARLQRVTLSGWLDEDQEPVSGAVFMVVGHAEPKAKISKPKPLSKHAKNLVLLEAAWRLGGCVVASDGAGLVLKSAFADALKASGLSDGSAERGAAPSGRQAAAMITSQMIEDDGIQYRILNKDDVSAWCLSGGKKDA